MAAVNALGDAQLADIPRRRCADSNGESSAHDQLFGRRRSPQLAIRAAIRGVRIDGRFDALVRAEAA
ncbi:MAG: hypothetical protein HS111_14445 [Kofleriaceae bacterium]|nr:hypothetical protein [Kofleriaceae bacterium]